MPEEPEQSPKDRSSMVAATIGIVALLAWCAMLWFMFGDVL